jgi:hypothetical protein
LRCRPIIKLLFLFAVCALSPTLVKATVFGLDPETRLAFEEVGADPAATGLMRFFRKSRLTPGALTSIVFINKTKVLEMKDGIVTLPLAPGRYKIEIASALPCSGMFAADGCQSTPFSDRLDEGYIQISAGEQRTFEIDMLGQPPWMTLTHHINTVDIPRRLKSRQALSLPEPINAETGENATRQPTRPGRFEFFRQDKFLGSSLTAAVFVDGVKIIQMKAGRVSISAEPGEYEIWTASGVLPCTSDNARTDCEVTPLPTITPSNRITIKPGEKKIFEIEYLHESTSMRLVPFDLRAAMPDNLPRMRPLVTKLSAEPRIEEASPTPAPPNSTGSSPTSTDTPSEEHDNDEIPKSPQTTVQTAPQATSQATRSLKTQAAVTMEKITTGIQKKADEVPLEKIERPRYVIGERLGWIEAGRHCASLGMKLPNIDQALELFLNGLFNNIDHDYGIWTSEANYVDQYVQRYHTFRSNGFTESENSNSSMHTVCIW